MDKKLRPIIKWTGGKYNEFTLFAEHIPKFERYIEPFFGGGGVFFALQPKVKSLLNDKSTGLVKFYSQIKNPDLHTNLLVYVRAWDELTPLSTELWENSKDHFIAFIKATAKLKPLEWALSNNFPIIIKNYSLFTQESFVIYPYAFQTKIVDSIIDKAKRIRKISEKEGKIFTEAELARHFETGLRSGVYLFFRSILNQEFNKSLYLDPAKSAANWYFIREFCYGSMFRFNAKGEFNIPYGGITYNRKNFQQKVENIFAPAIISLFKKATIVNQDFEVFLRKIHLSENDFIFLDPPYDSEFSEYDQNAFTQKDQLRLANFLIHSLAKWMVVIKETPFIREIYDHPNIKIKQFYKNYTYNVRGRNNRNVQHLIIMNY